MRSNTFSLILIAGMTLGGAAFAGTTSTSTTTATAPAATAPAVTAPAATAKPAVITASGTIKKLSTKGLFVVLSDGHKYHLPKGFSLKDFKVGQKVSVTYSMKGKLHEASAMKAA